jgi:hypothetical protein
MPRFQLLQPIKALGLGFRGIGPRAKNKSGPWMGGLWGFVGVMFLDCAVEAKAQRFGLRPLEARATDVVGFGSRRETMSQKGPERGPSWQNLDNQRSLGTDAFAASDRMTFQG